MPKPSLKKKSKDSDVQKTNHINGRTQDDEALLAKKRKNDDLKLMKSSQSQPQKFEKGIT